MPQLQGHMYKGIFRVSISDQVFFATYGTKTNTSKWKYAGFQRSIMQGV